VKDVVRKKGYNKPSGWGEKTQDNHPLTGNYPDNLTPNNSARIVWQDCPGCPKCSPTGGFILRKGNWRPPKAYEVVLMLTKTADYFCDGEAVRENADPSTMKFNPRYANVNQDKPYKSNTREHSTYFGNVKYISGSRNLRNVWTINPEPFKGAHFATYPSKLVATCVKAATSERGVCPKCGKQWARVMNQSERELEPHRNQLGIGPKSPKYGCSIEKTGLHQIRKSDTLGYMPTCGCYPEPDDWANWTEHYDALETTPAIVFDPFMGSGTTAETARRLGRHYIGAEISEAYIEICNQRLKQEVMEL